MDGSITPIFSRLGKSAMPQTLWQVWIAFDGLWDLTGGSGRKDQGCINVDGQRNIVSLSEMGVEISPQALFRISSKNNHSLDGIREGVVSSRHGH